MHIRLMHHPRMCALTNGVQHPVHSAPSWSSPQKSQGSKSQLCSKQNSNGPSLENFLIIGGFFESYMYCVTVLGKLKKQDDDDEQL